MNNLTNILKLAIEFDGLPEGTSEEQFGEFISGNPILKSTPLRDLIIALEVRSFIADRLPEQEVTVQ